MPVRRADFAERILIAHPLRAFAPESAKSGNSCR
jgi:hypothetical protein